MRVQVRKTIGGSDDQIEREIRFFFPPSLEKVLSLAFPYGRSKRKTPAEC